MARPTTRTRTPPHEPPAEPSDEATSEELAMAREQGEVLGRVLAHMTDEVAHDGGETRAGDYLVGYAVEEAEGMWRREEGEMVWVEPDEENVHVEVSVRDAEDGRFVPGLDVSVRLVADDGTEVGNHVMPFLWHPWLYHYGRNWTVPGDGLYRMEVHIGAPDFPRHDSKNGCRYTEPVDVVFEGVDIETGKDLPDED